MVASSIFDGERLPFSCQVVKQIHSIALTPFVLSLSKHERQKTSQLRRGLPGSKLLSFASPK
jgi:hypothetical protein